MRQGITNLILLLFIGLAACKKSPQYFIGKWQVLKVVENEKSNDLIENWIHLKSNGTFESYDGTLDKVEKGEWTYNATQKRILIEGEGKASDSQWILSKKRDTLFFHSTEGNLYLIAIQNIE